MILEEKKIKDGFVTLFDSDGEVTIQMELIDVKNIMNHFNTFIKQKQNNKNVFILFNNSLLDLELRFYDDNFNIEGRITEDGYDSTYFHDFNFEDASINTWEEVYEFING